MTKAINKLLAITLSFAMILTSFTLLGGAVAVNADDGDNSKITIRVIDEDGNPARNVMLWFEAYTTADNSREYTYDVPNSRPGIGNDNGRFNTDENGEFVFDLNTENELDDLGFYFYDTIGTDETPIYYTVGIKAEDYTSDSVKKIALSLYTEDWMDYFTIVDKVDDVAYDGSPIVLNVKKNGEPEPEKPQSVQIFRDDESYGVNNAQFQPYNVGDLVWTAMDTITGEDLGGRLTADDFKLMTKDVKASDYEDATVGTLKVEDVEDEYGTFVRVTATIPDNMDGYDKDWMLVYKHSDISLQLASCESNKFTQEAPDPKVWISADFEIDGTTIKGLSESGKEKIKINPALVLPDKNADGEYITAIADCANNVGAFGMKDTDATYVPTSVVLPEKLETIGKLAFPAVVDANGVQTGLSEVTFPETLTTIGQTAFQNAPLTEVILPDSVTTVGVGAFTGADKNKVKIEKVTLSKNLTTISQSMFNAQNISEITLPEGITKIERMAFTGNPLKTIVIPNGVTEIGANAFQSTDLAEVDIPASVKNIGNYAFRFSNVGGDRTSQLTKVTLHEGLTTIGNGAFANNKITEVILPSSLTSLNAGAFSNNAEKVKLYAASDDQANATGQYTGIKTTATSGHEILKLSDHLTDLLAEIPSDVTREDAEAIEAAREAYDALSEESKSALPAGTVEKLEAAEAKLEAVVAKDAQADAEKAQKEAEEAQKAAEDAQKEAEAKQAAAEEAQKAAEDERDAAVEAKKAAEAKQAAAEEAQKAAEEKQAAAEEAQKAAENERDSAVEAQKAAEDKQAEAEEARKKAEDAQKAAEDAKTEAEAKQAKAEEAQKNAEDAQKAAEDAKAEAEAKQAAAEAAQQAAEDAKSGSDGHASAAMALANSVIEASSIDQSKYTAKTASALKKAIESSAAILKKSDATTDEISAASTGLETAVKGLTLKKANTMTAKAKTVKVKAKTVKKKAVKVALKKAFNVKKAVGKTTYKKTKGNKKITVASNGKITVKKGLKKGTYKVVVKVTAAGNGDYKAATKTVTVKVKVK